MKSKSEEFCKARFDEFLRKIIPTSILLWVDVDKRDEPPDFYLTVNRTKYAVEVTQLVHKENIGVRNPLPVGVIRDVLDKFVKEEVEAVGIRSGYLRGSYLVSFSKPITNFTDVKKKIQDDLLSYISNTQTPSTAPLRRIYKAGRQVCEIEKLHDRRNKVIMSGPIISMLEDEELAIAKQIVDDRLSEKVHRLRKISYPKILLLHDKNPFSDRGTYKSCKCEESFLAKFHTVFIVGSNNQGEILYSKEPCWM